MDDKRDKIMKYKYKHETGGYGGCLLWILVILAIWLCSCTRYGCPSESQKVLNKAANRNFTK